ncbi:uncharacterized protein EDB93DRAFT_1093800 [Suillus bovinus]|uniref:uncharacterized protein n=1 Tax=Suillus bovinus TaxID=48563 RepID=UPI001B86A40A|nr:uncharacterized protein EDB93DRAFT_1093800 [Suillus bovinus]KAG2132491.1 hypothetical protein EDB93DRAFT_1093800 [Suillus bovinus]
MAWRAPDNLRFYIQEARLVSINLSSSQPSVDAALHALPRRYRKLRAIYPLRLELFNEYCQDWTDEFVPCVSLGEEDEDKETGERFTVPCPPFYQIPSISLARADSLKRLFTWIDLLPLETVRRAVHLLYPETKAWSFASDADDTDHALLKCITWSQLVDYDDERHCRNAMSIFIQPPWILSDRDLDLFCKRQSVGTANSIEGFAANVCHQSFGSSSSPWHERPTAPHERLWWKLWDCCITRSCPWFVVSTYTHWVFGVFSNGWTAAFVSPVYCHDSHDPSVLQLLLFWLCSAMGLPGGWEVPEVRIEPAYPSHHLTASVSDLAVTDKSKLTLWAGDG